MELGPPDNPASLFTTMLCCAQVEFLSICHVPLPLLPYMKVDKSIKKNNCCAYFKVRQEPKKHNSV